MFPYNILASAADKGLPEVEDPGTSRTSHAGCAELTPRADGDTEIWDKDLSMGTQENNFFVVVLNSSLGTAPRSDCRMNPGSTQKPFCAVSRAHFQA